MNFLKTTTGKSTTAEDSYACEQVRGLEALPSRCPGAYRLYEGDSREGAIFTDFDWSYRAGDWKMEYRFQIKSADKTDGERDSWWE